MKNEFKIGDKVLSSVYLSTNNISKGVVVGLDEAWVEIRHDKGSLRRHENCVALSIQELAKKQLEEIILRIPMKKDDIEAHESDAQHARNELKDLESYKALWQALMNSPSPKGEGFDPPSL